MKEKKTFNVRLDKKEWFFLKMYAAEQEKTMNDVLAEYVRKLLRKDEKGLDMLKC